jgi:hypothetical protein
MSRAGPSPYYELVSQACDDLEDELAHVRAEMNAGNLTAVEACAEHARLLERHLARCRELRREHLGDTE